MLPLLLLLVATQVPGETSLVTSCKQGRLSACEALRQSNPQQAAQLQAELARAAARQTALKAAEEGAREHEATEAEATDADADDADSAAESESCDCKGQEHHIISRPIAKRLEVHETLRRLYKPRDKGWVATAKDLESHCGYQQWHREVDKEVISWLNRFPKATQEQFEAMLKEIYRRPEMLKRFPHGIQPPAAPTLPRP